MKKALLLFFLALATFVFTSCAKLDQRDELVGDYTLEIHGKMAISHGDYSEEVDIESTGLDLTITKAEEARKVIFSGYYNCEATTLGKVIIVNSMHGQAMKDGWLFDLTFEEANGMFGNGTLSFVTEINGTATRQGVTYPLNAWIANEAYKKY